MEYLNNKKIIIAIDGFSSCGKSTFAKAIAVKLGYVFIDTGAMYRAVTLYAVDNGAIIDGVLNENKLVELLAEIEISFKFNSEREASDIYVNGTIVENRIRSIDISRCVSAVSGVAKVREKLVAMQQAMGQNSAIVMDGRDIGTVVFPDAELKIFMTADPLVRAKRRYDELKAKGEEVALEEIKHSVISRDEADQSRAISPLRRAEDAILLDNSEMSIPQQMEWVMERLKSLIF